MLESITKVVSSDNCVGCGACCVGSNDAVMKMGDTTGLYKVTGYIDDNRSYLCPFSGTNPVNIRELAKQVSIDAYTDEKAFPSSLIGPFLSVRAGYLVDFGERSQSSSGGGVTFLINHLLSSKKIDGVVHLKSDEENLFSYGVSYTIDEVKASRGTKYFPGEFSTVLNQIDLTKRYAFIGLPCYVRAIRLLQKADVKMLQAFPYVIGLVCGHQKTLWYTKYFAATTGVALEDIEAINYREPINDQNAHLYRFRFKLKDGSSRATRPIKNIFAEDWSLGLGMPVCCESCDDVSGELADVTFGDAWIDPYDQDSRGTNIIVFRNSEVEEIFEKSEIFYTDKLSEVEFLNSQAGSFRFRREGVALRRKLFNNPKPLTRVGDLLKPDAAFERDIRQRHLLSILLNRSVKQKLSLTNDWANSVFKFKLENFLSVQAFYASKHGLLKTIIPLSVKKILKAIFRIKSRPKRSPYVINHSIVEEAE